jgi:hypothetical protein
MSGFRTVVEEVVTCVAAQDGIVDERFTGPRTRVLVALPLAIRRAGALDSASASVYAREEMPRERERERDLVQIVKYIYSCSHLLINLALSSTIYTDGPSSTAVPKILQYLFVDLLVWQGI